MNVAIRVPNMPQVQARRPRGRLYAVRGTRATRPGVTLRTATSAEAPQIHALIEANLREGHLLPRSLDELRVHAPGFVVALDPSTSQIIACAELMPLDRTVAEVRSLVVDKTARRLGIGRALVAELLHRARLEGFTRLAAFTHDAGWFVRKGFSIVPHTWVPEKIAHDCHSCPLFRTCGQHAVILPLGEARRQVGA